MDTLNVVIASWASQQLINAIEKIDPKIRVINVASEFDSRRLANGFSDSDSNMLKGALQKAEVIFCNRAPPNILDLAPYLKWIQCPLAGVDQILTEKLVRSNVIITNTSGIHAAPISELVMAFMLTFSRNMVACYEAKQKYEWREIKTTVLENKTLGIVGLGQIGRAVARRAKAFDMRVIAIRRTTTKPARARYVDMVYPREQLKLLLSESDYVVLALPATPETEKMIGEDELRAMKPTAYLVNIGRGSTVDEKALIQALKEKKIAGAGLDCFSKEPLPQENEIWKLPNVFLTPKIANGGRDYTQPKIVSIFCENLKRYIDGKRLTHIVNKNAGY